MRSSLCQTWVSRSLFAVAVACLTTGVWGGLVKLYSSPVSLNSLNAYWVTFHGALMVCGFFGTFISVQFAATSKHWSTWIAPLLIAATGLMLVLYSTVLSFGLRGSPATLGFSISSAALLIVVVGQSFRSPSNYVTIFSVGVVCWLVGNLLWHWRWELHQLLVWWMGFVTLSIVAWRLQISRCLRPKRWQNVILFLSIMVLVTGLLVSTTQRKSGEPIVGIGMTVIAIWMVWGDIGRYRKHKPGWPKYSATCLLMGYWWLAISGLGLVFHPPLPKYGVVYDSVVHAFFLGFVMTMFFAQAHEIGSHVLNISMRFGRSFYVWAILLQISVLTRIIADIVSKLDLHTAGGIVNATAILMFAVNALVFSISRETSFKLLRST